MCGIAGFAGYPGTDGRAAIGAMLAAIGHRGPDDQGAWLAAGIALGHRRLSILDLSPRGHQPFVTPDGQGVITYNGEVYNHSALRAELAREGVGFTSRTDTEVVLQALHRWGPERAVPRFDGMFAFAYYDARTRTLWLARDRLGIKPMYVSRQDGWLAFASEQKALFAHPGMQCDLDLHAILALVLYERFDGAMTPYRQVEALAPGTLVGIRDGHEAAITYFDLLRDVDPARIRDGERRSADDLTATAGRLLAQSVRDHLASDVPVATFCSGGLDSGLVTAFAREASPGVVGYVADIEGMQGEERRRAGLVADALGIELRTVAVTPEAYYRRLPAAIEANDQPLFFSQDVAALMLAEVIRADGFKVVLSGDGADELFGGYDWYAADYRAWRRSRLRARWMRPAALFQRLGRLHRSLRPPDLRRLAEHPFGASGGLAGGLEPLKASLVDGARRQLRAARLFRKLEPLPRLEDRAYLARGFEDVYVHMRERLGTLDRMTMACAIEARVPFLGNALVDFGLHLPLHAKFRDGITKRLIKDLGARHLPAEILHLPKIGFQLHPRMFRGIGAMLDGGWVADLLKWRADDQPEIRRLLAAHPFYQFRLVALECWLRMRFGHESPDDVAERLWGLHATASAR